MPSDLSTYRADLEAYLLDFLSQRQSEWSPHYWGEDTLKRLKHFWVTGKLFRGSLSLIAYELFTQKTVEPALPLAAAVECMQSALLIHDDIIDQDMLRRGQPSLPSQYLSVAQEKNYPHPDHAATSLSICVGDLGIFLGFEALGLTQASPLTLAQLINTFAREYQLVGLGEMADAHLAFTPEKVTAEEILEVYRLKTARYTLVVPVLLAGILAEVPPELLTQLEQITEKFGLIFQIKDDELGIFGTEQQIGKPVTSDLREGKKTLFYFYGMTLARGEDLKVLQAAFGNAQVTESDLEAVKAIFKKTGVMTEVDRHLQGLETQVRAEIRNLANPAWEAFLNDFLNFNLLRKH